MKEDYKKPAIVKHGTIEGTTLGGDLTWPCKWLKGHCPGNAS
jgi:hypothetical protein